MIYVTLHWYFLPLVLVLVVGASLALADLDETPLIIALLICGLALLVRWLP